MANHKSAKKRFKQALKRNEVNRSLLSKIKNNINIFKSLISSKKTDELQKSLSSVNSVLARAVKKGLIKKEFASRKLSSLSNTIDKK
jgi:small subunit ribosomal protein S20|tara:strand:- start:157 stop:417 length:261 start_codon:yes stop_codon:yes gene_type:complete